MGFLPVGVVVGSRGPIFGMEEVLGALVLCRKSPWVVGGTLCIGRCCRAKERKPLLELASRLCVPFGKRAGVVNVVPCC